MKDTVTWYNVAKNVVTLRNESIIALSHIENGREKDPKT